MSFSKNIILGRLGKDPEIKTFEGGGKVAQFNLAVSEKFKKKDGTKGESTVWQTVKAWDKNADVLEMFVKKGDLLLVEGKIKVDEYEKDGQTRKIQYTLAERVVLMPNKDDEKKEAPILNDDDDDLPF